MLLGENASEVSRAWREARDAEKSRKAEEKRERDKRRIKELEDEVKRLKGEVSCRRSAALSLAEADTI